VEQLHATAQPLLQACIKVGINIVRGGWVRHQHKGMSCCWADQHGASFWGCWSVVLPSGLQEVVLPIKRCTAAPVN